MKRSLMVWGMICMMAFAEEVLTKTFEFNDKLKNRRISDIWSQRKMKSNFFFMKHFFSGKFPSESRTESFVFGKSKFGNRDGSLQKNLELSFLSEKPAYAKKFSSRHASVYSELEVTATEKRSNFQRENKAKADSYFNISAGSNNLSARTEIVVFKEKSSMFKKQFSLLLKSKELPVDSENQAFDVKLASKSNIVDFEMVVSETDKQNGTLWQKKMVQIFNHTTAFDEMFFTKKLDFYRKVTKSQKQNGIQKEQMNFLSKNGEVYFLLMKENVINEQKPPLTKSLTLKMLNSSSLSQQEVCLKLRVEHVLYIVMLPVCCEILMMLLCRCLKDWHRFLRVKWLLITFALILSSAIFTEFNWRKQHDTVDIWVILPIYTYFIIILQYAGTGFAASSAFFKHLQRDVIVTVYRNEVHVKKFCNLASKLCGGHFAVGVIACSFSAFDQFESLCYSHGTVFVNMLHLKLPLTYLSVASGLISTLWFCLIVFAYKERELVCTPHLFDEYFRYTKVTSLLITAWVAGLVIVYEQFWNAWGVLHLSVFLYAFAILIVMNCRNLKQIALFIFSF